jgi:hypothetical protein
MPPEHRYELWVVDARASVIEYGIRPGVVALIHTEIDPERQLARPLKSLRMRQRSDRGSLAPSE